MAKIVAPLFSLAASGTIADLITYVCGHYVKKKNWNSDPKPSDKQKENQTKWAEGCIIWQGLRIDKEKWKAFLKVLKTDRECAVKIEYLGNGFQLFMKFYMDEGPDGWPNYPLPPI